MHVMYICKQRNRNCLQRGAQSIDQHHYSTAEILPCHFKKKTYELGKNQLFKIIVCCFCLTLVWGMGRDCFIKLSKTVVFQHKNKLLGTSDFVQTHFSLSPDTSDLCLKPEHKF